MVPYLPCLPFPLLVRVVHPVLFLPTEETPKSSFDDKLLHITDLFLYFYAEMWELYTREVTQPN